MTDSNDKNLNGVAALAWGVVMTVCEPCALVRANVLWHLATGAQVVHVFFDDPDDPALADIGQIAGCHVVACDASYWRTCNGDRGRPASQMRRQTINANVAQSTTRTDWLFHIDADEFIWQDGDLVGELEALGPGTTELNLPVLERLFPDGKVQNGLFDGAFRASSDLTASAAVAAFGEFAPFTKRGQYSHGAGKSAVAVGQGLRLGVHNATIRGTHKWKRAPKHISQTTRLLHFDGVTPLHWVLKNLRYRLNSPDVQKSILQGHRATQIDWMLAHGDTLEDLMAAHRALFALTPERKARLTSFDLVREVPFDPLAVLGLPLPEYDPRAFDRDLLARNPWIDEILIPE